MAKQTGLPKPKQVQGAVMKGLNAVPAKLGKSKAMPKPAAPPKPTARQTGMVQTPMPMGLPMPPALPGSKKKGTPKGY